MQKRFIWIAAALVLIAIPAVIGLVALRDDDDRRAGALIPVGTGSHELKIDGLTIPGAAAGDVIEVDSWSWGASNTPAPPTGTSRTAGAAKFTEISIQKTLDNSSPQLFLATAKGTSYPRATLTSRKSGETQQEYLIITLEQVLVSSVQFSGHGADVPTEQITLNFGKATIEAKGVVGGKATSSSKATWDLAAQKGS